MALGTVQSGYRNTQPAYLVHSRVETEAEYAKLMEELAAELELALDGGGEESVCDEDRDEPSYRIGSRSFTEEEWEEFLGRFDAIEAVIRKLMEEEFERREKEQLEKEQRKKEEEKEQRLAELRKEELLLLLAESTLCTCYSADQEEEVRFITWYTKEGIFCRKAGEKAGKREKEWYVPFLNVEEYEKVMAFLKQFPEDCNLSFAANEFFWLDFLDNELDLDGFVAFMEGKNKEMTDYADPIGNSEFLQTSSGAWAEYLNPLSTGDMRRDYLHKFCMTCEMECTRKARMKA